LPPAVRKAVEPPANDWWLFRRVPGLKQLGGYVRHSQYGMPDRLETFQLLHRLGEENIFEPEFLARIRRDAPLEQQRATWREGTAKSLVNRMLAYDWKFTLADNDLPKVRWATQLAGVAVGFPLLSRELTDFSLSIPPQWKLKGLKLRWFFKEALEGFLPVEILRKKKHGFGLPVGHWLLSHADLRGLAEDSLQSISRRGIVRPEFARELLNKHLPTVPRYYGEMVWLLMMLEQWLGGQRHVRVE
jgi:asparagine synthase (glutamine-hydrolysing)